MKKFPLKQVMVVLAIGLTIVINSLANILPINNQTTAQISDSFSVYFVPAGYVFSIWGVIYLGLIAYAIFQFLPKNRDNVILNRVQIPVLLGCAANSVWILLWHYNRPLWSIIAMLVLLISLIWTYNELGFGKNKEKASYDFFWFAQVPFSIYLGWISVATIANITVGLYVVAWDGFGFSPDIWAAIMIIIAGVLTLLMNFARKDLAYMLVIVWALVGIALKFQSNIVIVLAVVLALIAILGSDIYIREKKKIS